MDCEGPSNTVPVPKVPPIHLGLGLQDSAKEFDLTGAKLPPPGPSDSTIQKPPPVTSLLVASSRAPDGQYAAAALRPSVVMVQYRFEQSSLEGIGGLIEQALDGQKVQHLGMMLHSAGGSVYLCALPELTLTAKTIIEAGAVREFFRHLIASAYDSLPSGEVTLSLDFMSCSVADDCKHAQFIARELAALAAFPLRVTITNDIINNCLSLSSNSFAPLLIYLQPELLSGTMPKSSRPPGGQSAAAYEKIRLLGKGAFGAAWLYRRREDDSLVVIKQINMHDLSGQERQFALNEVHVLKHMHHPYIIAYFDSFEEDGVLMIEMEYADGGALSTYLAKRDRPMAERDMLLMFQQMVSAVRYIHANNVLHRSAVGISMLKCFLVWDLKTGNIFLTSQNTVKVGDFGISKAMGTAKTLFAETVVGTPYYISPEICEGKLYNAKSDIWALGCILYEMANLQRTFEGSNVPALVNKIVKGQYEPIRGDYSTEFKNLVKLLLNKEPEKRPSAHEILYDKLALLLQRYESGNQHQNIHTTSGHLSSYGNGGLNHSRGTQYHGSMVRSLLYQLNPATLSLMPVRGLPCRVKIKMVSLSKTHNLALSSEKLVYAWGSNENGQLGLENFLPSTAPVMVRSLTGKSIAQLSAGSNFSVFCSENGLVLTCGVANLTGHGDGARDVCKPKLIDSLLSMDVTQVCCGPQHTVVLTECSKVFAWGSGADGRLGTGSVDDCQPNVVRLVRCGPDATLFFTEVGLLLAAGSNEYNKLCLNQRQGFFANIKSAKNPVIYTATPLPVKNLPCRPIDASIGWEHTAILLESGHIFACGRDSNCQLGNADGGNNGTGARENGATLVKSLVHKACVITTHAFTPRSTTATTIADVKTGSATRKPVALVHPFGTTDALPNVPTDAGNSSTEDNFADIAVHPDQIGSGCQMKCAAPKQIMQLAVDERNPSTLLSLSAVIVEGSRVFLVVETSAPPPGETDSRQPSAAVHSGGTSGAFYSNSPQKQSVSKPSAAPPGASFQNLAHSDTEPDGAGPGTNGKMLRSGKVGGAKSCTAPLASTKTMPVPGWLEADFNAATDRWLLPNVGGVAAAPGAGRSAKVKKRKRVKQGSAVAPDRRAAAPQSAQEEIRALKNTVKEIEQKYNELQVELARRENDQPSRSNETGNSNGSTLMQYNQRNSFCCAIL